jgi:hypothetical protein
MDKKIQSLLYRSFDEDLSAENKELLRQALLQSEAFRDEKEKIANLRQTIKKGNMSSFKPFFAERVLNRIHELTEKKNEASFFNDLLLIFRPLAIAAIILIIIIGSYNIRSSGEVSLEGALAVPEVTLNDAYAGSLASVLEEE